MIKINGGTYTYGVHTGFHDINLEIGKGDAVCIMGPNGSGKSTLLKTIVGLYALEDGSYTFNGQVIDKRFLKDSTKTGPFYQKFGFVFQNSEVQLFNTSVAEEIAFGPLHLGLTQEEVDKRVNDCLKLLKIERLKDRVPYHLSGGEQKLVAIASVLSMNPDIIILDEPFNGLSPKYRTLINQIIHQLHQSGKTLIISSHHFNQIRSIVDRVYVFSEDHTICRELSSQQLTDMPQFIDYLDNL
ncbi:ABC transporter ATP-binding protein [Lactobacillus sp. LL6]|uniref:energy-coupling factor ABC transporter ATP-binding protein n=1 Tax=Lactobacillus sp. LL6 TaxID=2596827 RepID=UPI001186E6AF|nr:ABC transporter ATP-binding protein [Lactobacillus sp. LL6]TSO25917.1 ABC transporter ATP-binding protein [Lactobacillus sp. LL6]